MAEEPIPVDPVEEREENEEEEDESDEYEDIEVSHSSTSPVAPPTGTVYTLVLVQDEGGEEDEDEDEGEDEEADGEDEVRGLPSCCLATVHGLTSADTVDAQGGEQRSSLTALLLSGKVQFRVLAIAACIDSSQAGVTHMTQGGSANADGEEEEDDDEYEDAPEQSAASSVAGTKRSREEDEEVDRISGDYGEFQEGEEAVAKRARTAADNAAAEGDEEAEEQL